MQNIRYFLKAEEAYKDQKYKEAAELYRLSAFPKGEENATIWGAALYSGIDGVKYIEESIYFLKMAADSGYADAMGWLANIYAAEDSSILNYEQAFYYANMAAENGNDRGCYIIGFLYYHGIHVAQDKVKACSYFEKASESRHWDSDTRKRTLYVLGAMNYFGEGGEINYQRAKIYLDRYEDSWFYGSHELDSEVYKILGMLYLEGLGTTKNIKEAYEYFIKSEKIKEDNELEFWIGIIIASNVLEDSIKDDFCSQYWLEKSCENGNEKALRCLKDEAVMKEYIHKCK